MTDGKEGGGEWKKSLSGWGGMLEICGGVYGGGERRDCTERVNRGNSIV